MGKCLIRSNEKQFSTVSWWAAGNGIHTDFGISEGKPVCLRKLI
jgi:hypothetical protein